MTSICVSHEKTLPRAEAYVEFERGVYAAFVIEAGRVTRVGERETRLEAQSLANTHAQRMNRRRAAILEAA